MKKLNWNEINHFSAKEFKHDPEKYAEPLLIYTLDEIREKLDKRIFPSPVEGAFVRFDGSESSQHFVGPKEFISRKTTAIDFFAEGVPFEAFLTLVGHSLVRGIGIYLDTNGLDGHPWIMFHMDIRKNGYKSYPLIWICKKDKEGKNVYYYPQKDANYWSLLSNEKLYRNRSFGIK